LDKDGVDGEEVGRWSERGMDSMVWMRRCG
jgi:hypothetical protein